jgi:hypothetical protein
MSKVGQIGQILLFTAYMHFFYTLYIYTSVQCVQTRKPGWLSHRAEILPTAVNSVLASGFGVWLCLFVCSVTAEHSGRL